MIYFDNAATSLHKPPQVAEAVCRALQTMGNAGRGAHEASLQSARTIYDTRALLADFFGLGNPSGLAFTSNSTEALNTAIKGTLNPGDHVITTVCEHNSVLRPLYELEEKGLALSFVPADKKGRPDYASFEKLIQPNTKAIVCTHASNLTGNLLDIERIGSICKKHKLLFILDASQSAGVFDIDMQKTGIDILCFTGHKSMLGPQGTGGICVREGLQVRPLKSGGSGILTYSKKHPEQMPTALEAGTLNGHGIAGLHAAVEFLKETGLNRIRQKEKSLLQRFYEGIKDLPGLKIYGDLSSFDRCAILSLNIGDYDSSEVADELAQDYGISTRPGAHCAPLMHEALGTVSQGAVRFSFSYFNTEEEIDAAIQALQEMTASL